MPASPIALDTNCTAVTASEFVISANFKNCSVAFSNSSSVYPNRVFTSPSTPPISVKSPTIDFATLAYDFVISLAALPVAPVALTTASLPSSNCRYASLTESASSPSFEITAVIALAAKFPKATANASKPPFVVLLTSSSTFSREWSNSSAAFSASDSFDLLSFNSVESASICLASSFDSLLVAPCSAATLIYFCFSSCNSVSCFFTLSVRVSFCPVTSFSLF